MFYNAFQVLEWKSKILVQHVYSKKVLHHLYYINIPPPPPEKKMQNARIITFYLLIKLLSDDCWSKKG